ncbi:type II toxin-antitoxin system PemK/MazF family toxin [Paenibacillus crassostreae]|uniref:mRNA interferase n=1 Tax=Paenibacillus crassostreae TaxID=1763538 RepID=A0A167C600_9BACL|nr:type II toxin-antitoxin system PemK/MazF family toxin [Paenibacillus crassostreae]AOZ91605.1 hypothetical protein LPB68_04825 [Paenibacillus crassostreae]OAB72820.1 hypothetical protein PNBC_15425 [Paenibacillus crassostreae]
MPILRGQIYWTDLGKGIGSEQAGHRPVLIIQNNEGNRYSPTVIVAPITDAQKKYLPTHARVTLEQELAGIKKNSVVLLEQPRTIDKKRLGYYIGTLSPENMSLVDDCILISLGLVGVTVSTKKATQ